MGSAAKALSKTKHTSYLAPSQTVLRQQLEAWHDVFREIRPRESWTYYDTFDWRLYQRNLVLKVRSIRKRSELQLHDLNGRLRHRLVLDRIPVFAEDLPPGALRTLLERVIEMRALLSKVKLKVNSESFRILDQRRKTVCRVFWTRAVAKRPDRKAKRVLLPRLTIEGVRGYSKAHQKMVRFVESELQLQPEARNAIEEGLEAVGVELAAYSSKVEVQLDPRQRADRATKQILSQLFKTMQLNQSGLLQDLDSEFLHDFRVSVRRTRSALAQIKGVFPSRTVRRFRKEFSWLGKVTGPVRDLDVYLLKIPSYQASLPQAVRSDLLPLRRYLKGKKCEDHRRLVKALKSKRYRRLIAGWQDFLEKPPPLRPRLPRAALPVLGVASDRIWSIYSKVIRKGSLIDPQTHPELLHVLRIECKKLRYLMEFFRSLYPAAEMDRLIKELKRLQDNLGDFNDYVVQQATLRRIASQPDAVKSLPVETLMCIGRLLERLEVGQRNECALFLRRFKVFSNRTNTRIFSQLFNSEPREANQQ